MPEQPHDERALLDAYAQATAPSPAEVERALTRTLARVSSADERPPNLPRARRRVIWAVAAGFATLVITGAALAGVRWLRAQPRTDASIHSAAQLDRDDEPRVEQTTQRVEPSVAQAQPEPPTPELPAPESPNEPEPSASIEATPAPVRKRERTEPTVEKPEAPATESPDDADAIADESRLLARARRALHDDDFAGALDWTDEHARRHPDGALTEERLILEGVAACRGGQRERGLAAAERLRERFPKTPALAKVEQACAED